MTLMMRSLLLVPGNSEENLEKAFACNADLVIVDPKASVDFLAQRPQGVGPQLYIRISDLSSGMADADLAAFFGIRPDGIWLPQSNGSTDIQQLSTKLRVQEAEHDLPDGSISIIAMAYATAASLLSRASYAGANTRLAGLAWGIEKLTEAISARAMCDAIGHYTDSFRLARTATLLAASAAGVAAIDCAFPNYHDLAGLEAECIEAARAGFTAKMAIHPAQIPIINAVFSRDEKTYSCQGPE